MVRMLGKKEIISTYCIKGVLDIYKELEESIATQLEEYGFNESSINHIIILVKPLKLNLLTKYKVDTRNRKKTRDFIKHNFPSRTIIPITIENWFLGGELIKKVFNGKIIEVNFYIMTPGDPIKMIFKDIFIFDKKLCKLSSDFKFYIVSLNNRYYILGIHYLSTNSIRKFVYH